MNVKTKDMCLRYIHVYRVNSITCTCICTSPSNNNAHVSKIMSSISNNIYVVENWTKYKTWWTWLFEIGSIRWGIVWWILTVDIYSLYWAKETVHQQCWKFIFWVLREIHGSEWIWIWIQIYPSGQKLATLLRRTWTNSVAEVKVQSWDATVYSWWIDALASITVWLFTPGSEMVSVSLSYKAGVVGVTIIKLSGKHVAWWSGSAVICVNLYMYNYISIHSDASAL